MEMRYLLDVAKISDKGVSPYEGLKRYSATGDVSYNKIVDFTEVEFNEKPSRANVSVASGEVIFAKMKDTIKVLKISEKVAENYIFSTGFTTLNPTDEINIDYLCYVLLSKYFQREKNKFCTGATQKAINNKNLKKIKIPVPSLETQEKIVKTLDMARALIEKRKEQLVLLDELIESIFYTMFGDPVRNEKGWEVKQVSEIGNVGSSKRVYISECVDKGIPFYRGKEISRLSKSLKPETDLFITKDHYEELKQDKGIPKIGDLLLPSICTNGEIWMVDTNEPFYFKDGRVLWIDLDIDAVNSYFISFNLSNILKRNFEGISSGSTFSELKIFLLGNIFLPIPPLSLQNEFAEKVQIIEQEKALLSESLALLEENYQSIMSKAFQGELFN